LVILSFCHTVSLANIVLHGYTACNTVAGEKCYSKNKIINRFPYPWFWNIVGEMIFQGSVDGIFLLQGPASHFAGFSPVGMAAVLYVVNSNRPTEMTINTSSSMAERFFM